MKSSAIVTRSAVVMFLAVAPLLIAGKTPTISTNPHIVTCNASTNNISVLLNKGKRKFQPAQVFPTGGQPESVAIADFNRDGNLDVVTANFASGTVSVLFGNGNGTFQPHQDLSGRD